MSEWNPAPLPRSAEVGRKRIEVLTKDGVEHAYDCGACRWGAIIALNRRATITHWRIVEKEEKNA